MNKQLLINMLKLAYQNNNLTTILNLYCEIEATNSLADTLSYNDFDNEFYTNTEKRYIKQCFNFILT